MVASDTLHHTQAQYMSHANTDTQRLEPACPLILTSFQFYVEHVDITQPWVLLYLPFCWTDILSLCYFVNRMDGI